MTRVLKDGDKNDFLDLTEVSEGLAFIRIELKCLDKAFIEATQSHYYEKASEFRFEKR